MKILCSISTKGRYDTTLPLAILSVIQQTRKVDKLVIFDDNDDPRDLRENHVYQNLFGLLTDKRIDWEVLYGQRKGQHFNHQIANKHGYDWVWRVDDDNFPESNVLENLCKYVADDVGAIGGSIIIPGYYFNTEKSTGKIVDIDRENNLQWNHIKEVKQVEHLHCSFLYRAGIADYNLSLTKVAHREETLFSYELKQKGYKILVVPDTITWHTKNPSGGIRSENDMKLFEHDENIFRNIIGLSEKTIVVLNCGMGDHIVFKNVLKDIKNPVVFSCYPQIIPGRSIGEAMALFGDIEPYNIYAKMDQWNWKDSLENAYRKLYNVEKKTRTNDHKKDLAWLKDEHGEIFDEIIEQNIYGLKEETVKDKVVIDIGANVGIFSILSAYLGAKEVVSIEPSSKTFESLSRNVNYFGSSNIKCLKKLVTDVADQEYKLSLHEDCGMNSMYHTSDTQQYETVKSITLTDLISEVGKTNRIALKIDCEGAEFDIIPNASKELFENVDSIHMEVHDDTHPIHKSYKVIYDKLNEFGFSLMDEKFMFSETFDEHGNRSVTSMPIRTCWFQKKKLNTSIIIPAYKPYTLLKNCIDSIVKNTDLDGIEIIVVCNGSDKESADLVHSYGDNFKLIWNDEPLGFTKAVNVGLKACLGEKIILINTDCVILDFKEKNYWINELLKPLDNPEVGIAGMDFMCINSSIYFFPFYFVAFRRQILEEIGLLDEEFSPGYFEDTDYCIRIQNKNYKMINIAKGVEDHENQRYLSEYPLWHTGEGSFNNSEERQKLLERNLNYLKQKWKNLF